MRSLITPDLIAAACRAAEPGLYDGSIASTMTPTMLPKPYTSATEYVASRQRILTRQMTAALKAVAPLILAEPLPVVAHKGPHDSDAELRYNGATIEQGPANWMDDRALDLERKQARRG